MQKLIPPLCLVLALLSLIFAFALFVVDAPEASVNLQRARADGDEVTRQAFEDDLEKQRFFRTALIVGLFINAGFFTTAAFLTMKPAEK